MPFTFKLKSHVKDGESFEDGQLLVDHLRGVSDIALETNRIHGLGGEIDNIISTICMCHDFGKASTYFQRYLKGEYNGELKNHGEISGYLAYYMLPEKWRLIGFICVKKHHGNIDLDMPFFDCDKEKIKKIAQDIEKNVDEINEIYNKDLSAFFDAVKSDDFLNSPRRDFRKKKNKFTVEELVWLQYIWSLLLTGDKTQLIRGCAYVNKTDIHEDYVKNYKEKLRQELIKKNPQIEKTELFNIRNNIYDEIIDSINNIDLSGDHVLSINVPTGTGKTIGVYGGAFRLLERIYNERNKKILPDIIYCIPFTSVIDQNYEVLEKIFKENKVVECESLILKHHSMTELRYRNNEDEEYKDYDARFCVENWQSTIITTTFVQMFDTIFKTGINSIGSRFHKLAGSIIILDEVQAIPPKYYKIIEEVFEVLCSKFNTYVITVTATKPLFLRGMELVKSSREIFNTLDRIVIENHTENTLHLADFCSIVREDIKNRRDKSFLIVLNTVKSSLKVLDSLKDSRRELIYLSTEIHPARRLEVINMIKEERDTKYVLVSTQLVEAGVDLDFHIVYRDFSTIDSINQTAGRANRNAVNARGIVKLYCLINEDDKDKKFSNYIYPASLLNATGKILKGREVIAEKDILSINDTYFKEVEKVKSNEDYSVIRKFISELNFKEIRDTFKLIEDDYFKEDVIVNYNDEAEECLNAIKEGKPGYQYMINMWRKLNKYKVSISRKDIKDINCYQIKGINVVNKEDYDKNRGIKRLKIEQW